MSNTQNHSKFLVGASFSLRFHSPFRKRKPASILRHASRYKHVGKGQAGFTLIEIMVASISFVVIFLGLAFFLQTGIFMAKNSDSMAECIRQYKHGIRILSQGDPTNNYAGVLIASTAAVCIPPHPLPPNGIATWIEYRANNATYQVWLATGQLFLWNLETNASQAIMGDPVIPRGDMATPPRIVATFAEEPWQVIPNSSVPTCMVRLPIKLFYDTNANEVPEEEEAEVSFHPAFYLRNSEP